MGYFKRFGDLCAVFGAFSAFMYVFSQYMAYNFKDVEGTLEKLKFFLSSSAKKDYRFYVTLILLFVLSFAVSTIFHKLPFITLAVSVLPMMQIVAMLDSDRLYERPMLYLVLSVAHAVGCLYECIRRDREDRGRRGAIGADLLGLLITGFCIYVLIKSKTILEIDFEKISLFERLLYNAVHAEAPDLSVFKYAAICFGVLVALRLALRDLYYIDALLSVIPLVGVVYIWSAGKIPIFGSVLAAIVFIYAVARVSVMLFCKPRYISKKKLTELKE